MNCRQSIPERDTPKEWRAYSRDKTMPAADSTSAPSRSKNTGSDLPVRCIRLVRHFARYSVQHEAEAVPRTRP